MMIGSQRKKNKYYVNMFWVMISILTMVLVGCASYQQAEDRQLVLDVSEESEVSLDVKKEGTAEDILKQGKSHKYSTEGAMIRGTVSSDGQIEYLNVEILGELGKEIRDYTFGEEYIVYTLYQIHYEEPFYMSDKGVKISEFTECRYLILEERLYDITDAENRVELSMDELRQFKDELQIYLEEFKNIR